MKQIILTLTAIGLILGYTTYLSSQIKVSRKKIQTQETQIKVKNEVIKTKTNQQKLINNTSINTDINSRTKWMQLIFEERARNN